MPPPPATSPQPSPLLWKHVTDDLVTRQPGGGRKVPKFLYMNEQGWLRFFCMVATGCKYLFWVLKSRAGTTFKDLSLPVRTRWADQFCKWPLLVLSKHHPSKLSPKVLAETGPGLCLSRTALAVQQLPPFPDHTGPQL